MEEGKRGNLPCKNTRELKWKTDKNGKIFIQIFKQGYVKNKSLNIKLN